MPNIKVDQFPNNNTLVGTDIFYTKQGVVERKTLLSKITEFIFGKAAANIVTIDYNNLLEGVYRNAFATHSPDGTANQFTVTTSNVGSATDMQKLQTAVNAAGIVYSRSYNGTSWTAWISISTRGYDDLSIKNLSTIVNWQTALLASGKYIVSGAGQTNSPDASTDKVWFVEVNAKGADTNNLDIKAVRQDTGEIFKALRTGGSWGSWSRIFNSSLDVYNMTFRSKLSEIKTSGTSYTSAHSGLALITVVGGGGGGGSGNANNGGGGGGGGGQIRQVIMRLLKNYIYPYSIGAAGAAETNGGNTVFGNITALGGLKGLNIISSIGGNGGAGKGAGGGGGDGEGGGGIGGIAVVGLANEADYVFTPGNGGNGGTFPGKGGGGGGYNNNGATNTGGTFGGGNANNGGGGGGGYNSPINSITASNGGGADSGFGGQGYGAGGGGAGVSQIGGAGAIGCIEISWIFIED